MAESPPSPDAGPDREPRTRKSRWGQTLLIIALGLLLAFVIVMHLVLGGFRGIH